MQNTPFAAQQEQVNKFLEANRRLGAQMDSMQGTTRIIYDTTGAVLTLGTYNFFQDVASKTWPSANIDQNRFQPGEGMVIKEISIESLAVPINFSRMLINLATINFYIGNQRVIKDLPLTAFIFAPINPLNTAGIDNISSGNVFMTSIRLRTNIVIPPQVQFRCELQLPFVYSTTSNPINLKMALKGYGKLFNPRQNY